MTYLGRLTFIGLLTFSGLLHAGALPLAVFDPDRAQSLATQVVLATGGRDAVVNDFASQLGAMLASRQRAAQAAESQAESQPAVEESREGERGAGARDAAGSRSGSQPTVARALGAAHGDFCVGEEPSEGEPRTPPTQPQPPMATRGRRHSSFSERLRERTLPLDEAAHAQNK